MWRYYMLILCGIAFISSSSVGRETIFLSEKILSPTNVNSQSFGLVRRLPVNGQVYAQPLVISNVSTPIGNTSYLLVATMHNTLYAFDIDNNHNLVWTRQLESSCPLPDYALGRRCRNYTNVLGEWGILSTPVVDTESMVMYVVVFTCSPVRHGVNIDHTYILHAIHIKNGTDALEGKIINPAGVPGSRVPFYSNTSNQRPGLILSDGYVYVAFASYCDTLFYAGWVMLFNSSTLKMELAFNTALKEGGVWQSGAPLTKDETYIYFGVGNGNSNTSTQEYGNSIVKLQPQFRPDNPKQISNVKVVDWFTPDDTDELNAVDMDLGSTQVLVVGDLLFTGSKQGYIYVMNKTHLGQKSPNNTAIIQFFQIVPTPSKFDKQYIRNLHSILAWKGPLGPTFYCMGETDSLKMFRYRPETGLFLVSPDSRSLWHAPRNSMPGGILSLSANGIDNGIVWISVPISGDSNLETVTGDLIAVDAKNVSVTLWRSTDNVKNLYGNFSKFNPVFVHGGLVYVPTFSNQIAIYGLLKPNHRNWIAMVIIGCVVVLVCAGLVMFWYIRRRTGGVLYMPIENQNQNVQVHFK